MKLFSKRQIAGAVLAKDLCEKMIFSSRASILGCDVAHVDAKAAKVSWDCLVLKMKENIARRM
jgi:hypothetical protein